MKKHTLFFALLASLTITSGLQAQYRWHIIYPDRMDTFVYGFVSISCSGESCSVNGEVWGHDTTKPSFDQMPDSNFILHSTDGGQTWNSIDTALPHWTPGKTANILLDAVDQIDSLDAIAVSQTANMIINTFDGWKTWQLDTGLHQPDSANFHGSSFDLEYPQFYDASEGIVEDIEYGYSLSTVDSGKHWSYRASGSCSHSYGDSMFRTFIDPGTMLTTHDNWNTVDTSLVASLDTSIHPFFFLLGEGDTLACVAYQWDTSDSNQSVAMARSTDLGADWTELPLPSNIKIVPYPYITAINAKTIVIAGKDSSEEIIMSTDRGATWQADTVPLDNGMPYSVITAVGISGSGRVFASIATDSNFEGSTVFAYLEKVSSGVAPAVSTPANFTLYPNPATNILNIAPSSGTISISDPLGRSYVVPRNGNTLDISTLPSGVYFISDGVSRAKFVKE
jgi:hypothetical protein